MPENIDPIDYFLYDNTTPSAHGRDWGIKAVPGISSQWEDLGDKFFDYSRMTFTTSPSELSGFSHAIGGFYKEDTNGYRYVLCVTFEINDHKARKSLAIVGMLFIGKDSLASFLEHCDPILTARDVFNNKTLPPKLEPKRKSNLKILGSNALLNEWKFMGVNAVRLERFEKENSSDLISDLLLKCIRDQKDYKRLPAILGVSSRFKKDELSDSGFDIIFCHEGTQKQGVELPSTIKKKIKKTTHIIEERATLKKSKRKKPSPLKFFFWLIAIFSVLFLLYWLAANAPEDNKESRETVPTGSSHIEPSNNQSSHKESTPGTVGYRDRDFLLHVQELLDRLEELEPTDLKETFAYKVIRDVGVLKEFEEKRTELKEILEETLPDLRENLLNLNLGYYFEEERRKNLSEKRRTDKIRSQIKELNLEQDASNKLENAYNKLEEAFGIEFRSGNGTLSEWCELLNEFYELSNQ